MTDFYLITGFLGAGKTSLLKSILPLYADRDVRLIINEFGKVGLDGTLLRDQAADLFEIIDGSAFCECRLEQFEAAIAEAMADTPDVIFVEASGLSDPGSIRTILAAYEEAKTLRYRGAVCVVDAPRFRKLVEAARACKKQLAVADLVLINKCDLTSEAECAAVETLLQSLSLARCVRTTFGTITKEQLESIQPSAHEADISHKPDLTLQKAMITISSEIASADVERILQLLAPATYRIKGLIRVSDGVFVADCVGPEVRMTPYTGTANTENKLVLLSGEGLPLRRTIQQALRLFDSMITLTGE